MWGRGSEHSIVVWNCALLGIYSEGNSGTVSRSTHSPTSALCGVAEMKILLCNWVWAPWFGWVTQRTHRLLTACCPPGPLSLLSGLRGLIPLPSFTNTRELPNPATTFLIFKFQQNATAQLNTQLTMDCEQWPTPHLSSRNLAKLMSFPCEDTSLGDVRCGVSNSQDTLEELTNLVLNVESSQH